MIKETIKQGVIKRNYDKHKKIFDDVFDLDSNFNNYVRSPQFMDLFDVKKQRKKIRSLSALNLQIYNRAYLYSAFVIQSTHSIVRAWNHTLLPLIINWSWCLCCKRLEKTILC